MNLNGANWLAAVVTRMNENYGGCVHMSWCNQVQDRVFFPLLGTKHQKPLEFPEQQEVCLLC